MKDKAIALLKRAALYVAIIAVGTSVVTACSLMWFEDSFIYYPVKHPAGPWGLKDHDPGEPYPLPLIEDAWMETADGTRVHGWYAVPFGREATPPEPVGHRQVVLFFHGNAGNLADRYELVLKLLELGVRVLIIDYPGYGRSEGTPDEKALYASGRAAWEYLVGTRGYEPSQIVLLGKSLGGAPATKLATEVSAGGVILQSTFTSVPDMAKRSFPFLPRFLVRTRMNNLKRVREIEEPKLFIHSPSDEIIPYEMGRRLFEAAPEPRRFHKVEGAGHNETEWVGGEAYWNAIDRFLTDLREGQSGRSGS